MSANFGWSYPPGMSNLPWDAGADCEHVCEYCDGCHDGGCPGYEVLCASAKKQQDVTLRVGAVVRVLLPNVYKGAFGVIENQTTADVYHWLVRLLPPYGDAVTLYASTEIENVLSDEYDLLNDEDLQKEIERTDQRIQSLLIRSQCPPEYQETYNILQRLYAELETEKSQRQPLTILDQDNNEYYGHGRSG